MRESEYADVPLSECSSLCESVEVEVEVEGVELRVKYEKPTGAGESTYTML